MAPVEGCRYLASATIVSNYRTGYPHLAGEERRRKRGSGSGRRHCIAYQQQLDIAHRSLLCTGIATRVNPARARFMSSRGIISACSSTQTQPLRQSVISRLPGKAGRSTISGIVKLISHGGVAYTSLHANSLTAICVGTACAKKSLPPAGLFSRAGALTST